MPADSTGPQDRRDTLLDVRDLNVSYGRVHVLQDVSFTMGGESLGILGRNGMGKSTLVNALVGFLPAHRGSSARFAGDEIIGRKPHHINRLGIACVPQGRRIFPSLTVHEHLTMVGAPRSARWNTTTVYELFPRLAERRRSGGADLSGGEQQMLAIARALLSNPRLIIMDEPSEGLAPAIVAHLTEVFSRLAGAGQAVLLIEQNLHFATELCDRLLMMVNGRIAGDVTSEQLRTDHELQTRYLGV